MVPRVVTVRRYPLNESASVVLATLPSVGVVPSVGYGGAARLGPKRPGEMWIVRSVAVTVDSTIQIPRCRIYQNVESPNTFIGGTEAGHRDSDNSLDLTLFTSEQILSIWEGGDNGARATVTLGGIREVGVW